MAPKPSLIKDPPKPKKHIPQKPLTTQGKIEKVRAQKEKAKKNQPRPAPSSSTSNSPNTNPTRPAKPKSFLPPNELDQLSAANAAAAKKAALKKGVWDFKKGKPMTTQQKEAQARAAKKTKGGVGSEKKVVEEGSGRNAAEISFADEPEGFKVEEREEDGSPTCTPPQTKGKGKGKEKQQTLAEEIGVKKETRKKSKKEKSKAPTIVELMGITKPNQQGYTPATKPPGMMRVLAQHEPNALPMVRKPPRGDSVLMRPTLRTMRYAEQHPAVEAVEKKKQSKINIMDLPDEVRNRIWRSVVVQARYPIWPEKAEGREQPDLAMSCRQVRAEVLPIYYSENTFGVNLRREEIIKPLPGSVTLLPSPPPSRGAKVSGLAAVGRWAKVLGDQKNEGGRWLDMIRSWAFDFQDEPGQDEKSFLVSMRFPKPAMGVGSSSVPQLGLTSSPTTEIHRWAACVMSDWTECGKCVIQKNPNELNDAVIHMLESGGLTAKNLVELARKIRGMTEKLAAARCGSV